MKNVITRSLSGIVYVALIVAAVTCGTQWYFALTVLLAAIGIIEFYNITGSLASSKITLPLDIVGAVIMLAAGFMGDAVIAAEYLAYIILRFTAQIYIKSDNPIIALGRSALTQMYITLPLAISVLIHNLFGYEVVLCMFIFIWINDTGAFCIGSLMGKHRLFERISPKKSWEGFWGGFVLCAAVAFALSYFGFLATEFGTFKFVILACIISIFSTFGDLIESLLKRSIGIKDSGNIIPGHGGILDRIDSFLLVSPAVFCYIIMVL